MLVCTKVRRDYEPIFTVEAYPGYMRLALLMRGLEPRSPMTWNVENDGIGIEKLANRSGIAVSGIYSQRDRLVEVSINKWVLNQQSKKMRSDNIWVFAESKFIEDQEIYRADLGGSVLTLVNFRDKSLARRTAMTELNDEQSWVAVREMIPPAGTVGALHTHRLLPAHPDRQSKQGKG